MTRTANSTVPLGVLAIIGGGRMGEAILAGLLAADLFKCDDVIVAEPDEARRHVLTERYGVRCVAAGTEALSGADVSILAVKPQVLGSVVTDLSVGLSPTLVISVAAGISCARIESLLAPGAAVVRVMPNAPAMVGEGMALISAGSEVTEEQVNVVVGLFSALGECVIIEELQQDVGTAISGSGPAYFALVVDALACAGVEQGMSRVVAQQLAVQTMLGTARLLLDTGAHPADIINEVASPGGTTVAALERLEANGVRFAFADAVNAALGRSKELGVQKYGNTDHRTSR